MARRQFKLFWCLVVLSVVSGCTLGPNSLRQSRLNYNRAVQQTTREELLMNLVRMRYHESEEFLRIPSITGQYSYDVDLGGTGSWDDTAFKGAGLGFGMAAQSKPTIVYAPEQGMEFNQRKLTPISLETIDLLGSKGWAVDRVLRLTVRNINDVDNATSAGGPTPSLKPQFEEFLYLTELLRHLQLHDHSLEVARIRKVSSEPVQVSGELPLERITGEDIVHAAENGYRFEIGHEQNSAALWKNAVKADVPVLRFSDNIKQSEEVREICRILELNPDLPYYELKTDVNDGQLSKPNSRRTGITLDRDDIILSTRSLKEMMFYLSHAVMVPDAHMQKGYVRLTRDETGCVFDWRQMTKGLFEVHHSKHRPRGDASIAVQHKGYWFYILECDLDSKSTFNLLLELMNLEIRAGGGQQLPLLTI